VDRWGIQLSTVDKRLARAERLREMGLSPQWQLRERTSMARLPDRGAGDTEPPRVATTPVPMVAEAPSLATGTVREQAIARMDWAALQRDVAACRACGLCQQRRQAVLGVGDTGADWLFIGEGPGAEEDARGEPFVGPAGKLLDAMLAAIDLRRGDDVYIANAVKCRPPGNRTPESAEMVACAPYLKRQIALLQPRLIVLLGRAAAHALLGNQGSLASLRGQTFSYPEPAGESGGIPMLVTYHPAYLLRTLPDKAKAWEDLCRARALMRQAKSNARPSV
jgi:DNA polymerase